MKNNIQKNDGLKLTEREARQWEFEYPPLPSTLVNRFYDGVDLLNEGKPQEAEVLFREVIESFRQHIDAYHYLSLALFDQGRAEEAILAEKSAVEIGYQCIPEKFEIGEDAIEWDSTENRPFLRALFGMAMIYADNELYEEAASMIASLIMFDPQDSQAARGLLILCFLKLEFWEELLAICENYAEDDDLEEVIYAYPLALFRTGNMEKARTTMLTAIERFPAIAQEIIKAEHMPTDALLTPTFAATDENSAEMYWELYGEFWIGTEGAIGFVRECVQAGEG